MALFFPAGSEWAFWGSSANTVGPFAVKDDASALRHLTKIYLFVSAPTVWIRNSYSFYFTGLKESTRIL